MPYSAAMNRGDMVMASVTAQRYIGKVMHRLHMEGYNYATRVNKLMSSPPGAANIHIEEIEMEAVDRWEDWATDPLD